MAHPTLDDGVVTLSCQFPFHQKRLKEPKNRQIIADLLSEQLGKPVSLECTVNKDADTKPATTAQEPAVAPALDTISNIFGATEVLES